MNNNVMNIDPKDVSGNCNLKCNYSYSYANSSSCVATNYDTFLKFTYDNTNVPPVTFNNAVYTIQYIMLNAPSIHNFNGSAVSAEITIVHIAVNGNGKLMVCIPIIIHADQSKGTDIITELIEFSSRLVPNNGNTSELKLSNYSLNDIIPKKSYYYYKSADLGDWIVFGKENAIHVTNDTIDVLKRIIRNNRENVICPPNSVLFFNTRGTIISEGEDEIYIDCQPTGESEEKVVPKFNGQSRESLHDTLMKYFNEFLVFLLILAICIGFYVGYNYIVPPKKIDIKSKD